MGRAAGITVPTLVVHSDGCGFPSQARRFHDLLAGPKSLAWPDGAHFDYYDSAPHIDRAVEEVTAFLRDKVQT